MFVHPVLIQMVCWIQVVSFLLTLPKVYGAVFLISILNSIGIELVNLGPLCSDELIRILLHCANSISADGQQWGNYTPAQINALVNLVSDITSRYNIPIDRDHIIGHYQITTYKSDPGPQFPWDDIYTISDTKKFRVFFFRICFTTKKLTSRANQKLLCFR